MRSSPVAIDLQVTQDIVSRVFKKVNAHKAAGPDGIASRVLKTCYNQLSWVYNDIFNMSLSLCVVPFCLKKTLCPLTRKTLLLVSMIIDLLLWHLFSWNVLKGWLFLIKSIIHVSIDPLQFACCSNRSVDDAIALALHTALVHLEKKTLMSDYCS